MTLSVASVSRAAAVAMALGDGAERSTHGSRRRYPCHRRCLSRLLTFARFDPPASEHQRTPLAAGRSDRFRFLFRNEQSADVTAIAYGRTERKNCVSADAGILFAGDLGIDADDNES